MDFKLYILISSRQPFQRAFRRKVLMLIDSYASTTNINYSNFTNLFITATLFGSFKTVRIQLGRLLDLPYEQPAFHSGKSHIS